MTGLGRMASVSAGRLGRLRKTTPGLVVSGSVVTKTTPGLLVPVVPLTTPGLVVPGGATVQRP